MGGLEVLPEQDSGEGKDLEENSSCHWGCELLGYKAMGWGTLTESPGRPLPSKDERGQDPGGVTTDAPRQDRKGDARCQTPKKQKTQKTRVTILHST